MHYEFGRDLKIAKKTEIDIAELICSRYNTRLLGICDTNRFDILLETKSGRRLKLEIKEDFMASKTGNIAIEFESRGRPSGISTTQATHWLYKIVGGSPKYLMIRVDELKKLIASGKYWKSVSGGDIGSNTKMYLFTIDDFSNHSIKLNI